MAYLSGADTMKRCPLGHSYSNPMKTLDFKSTSHLVNILIKQNLDSDLVVHRFIRSTKAGSLDMVLNNRRPLRLKLLAARLGQGHLV